MGVANVSTPILARFQLYSSPVAVLKSDGSLELK